MGEPVNFLPSLMPMPATVWRGNSDKSPRGYVDVALGSWLDGRLLAGYDIIRSGDTSLDIRFDGLSTALYKPENALSRRRRLDGTLGLDFSRKAENGALIYASGQYHLGWFNYELLKQGNVNNLNPVPPEEPASPTQTLNDASARVGWKSDRNSALRWNAGASFRYFAYRSSTITDLDPTRETSIRLDGGIDGDVGLGSTASDWGVGIDANLNTYSGSLHPGTNGLVSLTPAWNISRPLGDHNDGGFRWQARIGARMDLSFNHTAPYFINPGNTVPGTGNPGKATERFGLVHIAPDCSVAAGFSWGGIRFTATGGTEEQTLGRLNDADNYASPLLTGSLPAFTPADLRLALILTPCRGVSATVEGRWKETRHIYAGALWTMILQHIPQATTKEDMLSYRSTYYNLHGFSLRVAADWKASRWFELGAEATWQPQHKSKGWFNGYDRPVWTTDINVSSHPWRGLGIGLEWNLRALRSATLSDALDWSASIPLDNLSDLSARVSYSFSGNFEIGVTLSNLLNRKTMLAPGFISEGFTATGALQFLF